MAVETAEETRKGKVRAPSPSLSRSLMVRLGPRGLRRTRNPLQA